MPPCHGGGHGFESHTHRESLEEIQGFFYLQYLHDFYTVTIRNSKKLIILVEFLGVLFVTIYFSCIFVVVINNHKHQIFKHYEKINKKRRGYYGLLLEEW